ncbi:UDP-N-acetylmuramoyl-tripeptide--D-alanyl-D-alanine ligase [Catalinimonas alkaloidigena]|uniref:UDP-N-acetylmuramoyl-tripeptide--D-alanyl-D-alanine ligase n=1 Tax=Catalinimonas alkaloidigena TaxID=1075417 RepID=A0A1G9QAT2_9BACT|nr:UDP-N-acetylmuramoyl-tripeptide--D-alanyl-D-alanine ligase [Catalinimonas alkaloidigena]SDM08040.1 UDP-N-acetylmuramoyl-tripeptide--D-alanyl-D-alanine ligase [Catalinimonas alkaloidigena]
MYTSTETLYRHFQECGAVSTDTRRIPADSIFIALKGPRFNGNQFAAEALQQGACYAVVDERDAVVNERCLLVEDGLKALQNLARMHRRQLSIPVLAVGGSNGKTTTKELIAAVLGKKFRTFATRGNLNNHIGVPLTLLSIFADTEMAVIEMGANAPDEIDLLCRIAEPTHGIITNVGLDHLEGFGSHEGVIRANGELYDYLAQHEGMAFVNTNEPDLVRMAEVLRYLTKYPNPGDFYHCTLLPSDFFVKVQAEDGTEIQTQLFGRYNFPNIATALCIGKYFEVPPADAHAAIADYVPKNNRSQLVQKDHNTILLDAYNANPSSMQAAVENLAHLKAAHKTVILGDMLEMGHESESEHRKLGQLLQRLHFDTVLLCGHEMQYAHREAPGSHWFADRQALKAWLADHPIRDSYVLLKGSRGIGLEEVVEGL